MVQQPAPGRGGLVHRRAFQGLSDRGEELPELGQLSRLAEEEILVGRGAHVGSAHPGAPSRRLYAAGVARLPPRWTQGRLRAVIPEGSSLADESHLTRRIT